MASRTGFRDSWSWLSLINAIIIEFFFLVCWIILLIDILIHILKPINFTRHEIFDFMCWWGILCKFSCRNWLSLTCIYTLTRVYLRFILTDWTFAFFRSYRSITTFRGYFSWRWVFINSIIWKSLFKALVLCFLYTSKFSHVHTSIWCSKGYSFL